MMNQIGLNRLPVGGVATVTDIAAVGAMRRRFLDIGLIENTRVRCLGRSPAGDPSAYLIRGAVIAIRKEDSAGIRVRPCRGGECDGPDE